MLGYEDAMHMDAFSLDHHDVASAGSPLNDAMSGTAFGFGQAVSPTGLGDFSNAFTSVDSQLKRLHDQYDVHSEQPAAKVMERPKSLFDITRQALTADTKTKIDAPVAKHEETTTT